MKNRLHIHGLPFFWLFASPVVVGEGYDLNQNPMRWPQGFLLVINGKMKSYQLKSVEHDAIKSNFIMHKFSHNQSIIKSSTEYEPKEDRIGKKNMRCEMKEYLIFQERQWKKN